jgi:hypothetical protein
MEVRGYEAIQTTTEIIANDTTITVRSVTSHAGIRCWGMGFHLLDRHVVRREAASGYEIAHKLGAWRSPQGEAGSPADFRQLPRARNKSIQKFTAAARRVTARKTDRPRLLDVRS